MKTETKTHTPAPWEWEKIIQERGIGRGKTSYGYLLATSTNRRILTPNWNTDHGEVWQAFVNISDADAAIIQAAPELFEALDRLDRLHRGLEAWHEDAMADAWVKARAALVAARGGRE